MNIQVQYDRVRAVETTGGTSRLVPQHPVRYTSSLTRHKLGRPASGGSDRVRGGSDRPRWVEHGACGSNRVRRVGPGPRRIGPTTLGRTWRVRFKPDQAGRTGSEADRTGRAGSNVGTGRFEPGRAGRTGSEAGRTSRAGSNVAQAARTGSGGSDRIRGTGAHK